MIALLTRFQYYIFAALIAIAFAGGVTVANWHNDSLELVAEQAAKKASDQFQVDQSQIADNVEKSLNDWRQKNVIIQEKITKEKLQPVFSNVCVSDDYPGLFNQQTNSLSTSGSSKSSTKAGN